MTMIRYTDEITPNKKFILPFVDVCNDSVTNTNDDQNGNRPEISMLCGRKVCRSAIAALLDFSSRKWKTCADAVKNNKPPIHGGKYNSNASSSQFTEHCVTSLHEFFEGLKDFAKPESTCFVREETGSGLHYGEETQYQQYYRWTLPCFLILVYVYTATTKNNKRTVVLWLVK
jgi:hypothetical protein